MNITVKELKVMAKKGLLQEVVSELLTLVESDKYRDNDAVKGIYYNNFSDGGTIKDMAENEGLKIINSSDDIGLYGTLDNFTEYSYYMDEEIMIVNYLNETTVLRALRDLEKLI